jgi:hypothetical protein
MTTEIAVGDELAPFVRVTDFPEWNRYAAVNDEFIDVHMSADAAQAAGQPDVFGMGNLRIAYAHNLLHDWLDEFGRALKVGYGNRSLFALKLCEFSLARCRQRLGVGPIEDGIKTVVQIGLGLFRGVVVETRLAHAIGPSSKGGDHTRVLLDAGIAWVVVGRAQLFGTENLLDGGAGAPTGFRKVLSLERNRKCSVGDLVEEGMIVGILIGLRQAVKDLHILFTQTDYGRAVSTAGWLRTNAVPVRSCVLFSTEPRSRFIGGHRFAYSSVIYRDVLEPGITHACGDQRLYGLDARYELLCGHAELLRARQLIRALLCG